MLKSTHTTLEDLLASWGKLFPCLISLSSRKPNLISGWTHSICLCTSTFHLLLREQEAFYSQISLLSVSTSAITLAFPLGKQFGTEFVFLNPLIYHPVLKKGHEQDLDIYISPSLKHDQPDGELILTPCEFCIPYTCKIKDIWGQDTFLVRKNSIF